jgi:uncharacterized protein (UPF0254 family)
MTRRYCTIPEIGNLRKWYEKNFNKPCKKHDYYYETMKLSRSEADKQLAKHMAKAVRNKSLLSKVFVYYPTIGITYAVVRVMGWSQYGKE